MAAVGSLTAAVSGLLSWRSSQIRELRAERDDLREENDRMYRQVRELQEENLDLGDDHES